MKRLLVNNFDDGKLAEMFFFLVFNSPTLLSLLFPTANL